MAIRSGSGSPLGSVLALSRSRPGSTGLAVTACEGGGENAASVFTLARFEGVRLLPCCESEACADGSASTTKASMAKRSSIANAKTHTHTHTERGLTVCPAQGDLASLAG